jgi:hypothetical protein
MTGHVSSAKAKMKRVRVIINQAPKDWRVKGGVDRPLRLRTKNIAPSTRGIGKPAKAVGFFRELQSARTTGENISLRSLD